MLPAPVSTPGKVPSSALVLAKSKGLVGLEVVFQEQLAGRVMTTGRAFSTGTSRVRGVSLFPWR